MNSASRKRATCQHEVIVKLFQLTSVASNKLHFESNQSQNSLRKASYITNSLLCSANTANTLRERAFEASSARVSKLHTTPLKMTPLYRYSIQTWFKYFKPVSVNQTHKKRPVSGIIFIFQTRKIPIFSSRW